jgi:hypothetical protein
VPNALPIGIEYTVKVRFIETSPAFDAALATALADSFGNDTLGRFVGNYPGLLENLTAAFPSVQQSTPVPHADADEVLAWLAAADGAFPEVTAGPDETRLFFLNPTAVAAPYYYKLDSQDLDSGVDLTFETANAWGGLDGIFFQDLRAAPNHLGEGSVDARPANFLGQPPIWSYGPSAGERARFLADLAYYVNMSVRILAAPSYAVTPYYPASLHINATLFDATSSQDLFSPGGAGAAFGLNASDDVLQPDAVRTAVSGLMRAAPVTVSLRLANRADDPVVSAAIDHNIAIGAGGGLVLDPFGLNNELKAHFGVPNQPVLPGDHVVLPALVVVTDGDCFVQAAGTRGATLQRSDGRAASILIAAGLSQVSVRGLTDTLIHEAGHALGLGHPHELAIPGAGSHHDLVVDWLRDLTSTPMTYLPSYADHTFDSFDLRAVESGMAAVTLGAAYIARKEAYAALDSRGYTDATLPPSFATAESLFQSFAASAVAAMAAGNFYEPEGVTAGASGAAVSAKRAYDQAKDMLIDAVLLPRCCPSDQPSPLPGPGADLVVAAVAVAVLAAAGRRRWR